MTLRLCKCSDAPVDQFAETFMIIIEQNYIKMADDQQLVLSEVLYYIVNKFGKTGRNELNSLRNIIVDFYNVDVISTAKCRLLDDVLTLTNLLSEKAPRVPRRREAADQRNRALLEVDDIFKQLIFLDEKKLMDQLPMYVSANSDYNPSTKLCEGDLKFLFMYMDRMEARLQGFGSQLSAITRDVRSLMRTETRPVHIESNEQAFPPLPPPALNNPTRDGIARRPNNHASTSSVAQRSQGPSIMQPRASVSTCNNTQPDETTDKSTVGNSKQTHSYWADESADEAGPYSIVESRRERRKRRRLLDSQQQDGYTSADVSADDRISGNDGNLHRRRRVQREPLMIGKASVAPDTEHKTMAAGRPIIPFVKKLVFCVDNVDPHCTDKDMQQFVESLSVGVVSCNQVKPRRSRHETDTSDRSAFRLCIKASDRDKLLNADKWPEYVCISKWFSVRKENGDGSGSGIKTRDKRTLAGAEGGATDTEGDMETTIFTGPSTSDANN